MQGIESHSPAQQTSGTGLRGRDFASLNPEAPSPEGIPLGLAEEGTKNAEYVRYFYATSRRLITILFPKAECVKSKRVKLNM